MLADIERYIRNYHFCRRTSIFRNKTPGLLQSLPIPDRPWQYISMDFVSFNRDKHGYDNILIIINYLLKKSISIPCYKTITAEKIALLFIYVAMYDVMGTRDIILAWRYNLYAS
jgi:hypothetical protein